MPGEYAYTLPASELSGLSGRLVFRVAGRAPGQRRPTVVTSPAFRP
jgi:hypothetical protein